MCVLVMLVSSSTGMKVDGNLEGMGSAQFNNGHIYQVGLMWLFISHGCCLSSSLYANDNLRCMYMCGCMGALNVCVHACMGVCE